MEKSTQSSRQARDYQVFSRFIRFGLLLLLVFPTLSEARRFDMKSERFATYISGSLGPSALSDSGFGLAAGTGNTTDQIVPYNLSGEFGVAILTNIATLRLGLEYVKGKTLTGVNGLNSSGTPIFAVDSTASAVFPSAGFEVPVKKWTESRIYVGAGVGYGFIYLDQEYRMTAAGAGLASDYTEKGTASAIGYRGYVGAETLLVDTATISFELGYRSLKAAALTSSKDTTAIVGSEPKGSDLLNSDGSKRALDFTSGYASLLLRFYL